MSLATATWIGGPSNYPESLSDSLSHFPGCRVVHPVLILTLVRSYSLRGNAVPFHAFKGPVLRRFREFGHKTAYCRKAGKHINLIRPSDKCMQSITSYIKQIYNLIWYVPPKLVGPCNSLLSKAPWRPKKRLPRRLRRQRRALLAPGRWSRQFSLRRAVARAMAAKAHTTTCHASLRRTDVLLVVSVAHKCTQQWV